MTKIQPLRIFRVEVTEAVDAFPGTVAVRRVLGTFATERAAWTRIDHIHEEHPDLILGVYVGGTPIVNASRLYDGHRRPGVAVGS